VEEILNISVFFQEDTYLYLKN